MDQHRRPIEFDVPGIDSCVACWHYRGEAAGLVRELKYARATKVVSELADAIAVVVPSSEIISWIPATPTRRRRRGFDQCELLARAVARRTGGRVVRLLRRADDRSQTSRDMAGRLIGPRLDYVGSRRHARSSVVLIDDVSTTGSTLAAAAASLRANGHAAVSAVVVAKVVLEGATHGARCRSILGDTPITEVKRGNLHQQPARQSHAETGGGDTREDW